LVCAWALAPDFATAAAPQLRVGSKKFTESVILGDLATELLRDAGLVAEHRRELGGTAVLWHALLAGELDVYPEYTGTLTRELLSNDALHGEADLRRALQSRGIGMSGPLGFEDTYAIGVPEALAERLGLRTLSDLARHPELRLGLSHEFLERADGWPLLRDGYGMGQRQVRGLDHDLAYRALASGAIQATDLYSTDAEIRAYGLRVLRDDRKVFPDYAAVFLYRLDLARRALEAVPALERLVNRIPRPAMIAMNARAKLDGVPADRVAAEFLAKVLGVAQEVREPSLLERVGARTEEHLFLVALSLAAAILIAIPLGIGAARWPRWGQAILAAAGVVQTIPSLALLVFMIPLLGIGARPAVAALFLYSLLPILRNTFVGLRAIPADVRDSAEALGLPRLQRLWRVDLPMASPAILAGIKTAAVIDVGTATLGALIGAGGYGQPILAGIRLDDVPLILEGAVPAAAMALLVQGAFDLAERWLVPKGLRLASRAG
jgi:osmoprotectant transport system permease protein